MGLYREIMRANAPVLKFHQEFYGDYERFNDLESPDQQAIANFQMEKLMTFQAQAFKTNKKTERINQFLKINGQLATSTNEFDKIVYNSMSKLFTQINELISRGYMSRSVRESLAENQQLELIIVSKLEALGNTLNTLRSQANMTISSSYITRLDNIIMSLLPVFFVNNCGSIC